MNLLDTCASRQNSQPHRVTVWNSACLASLAAFFLAVVSSGQAASGNSPADRVSDEQEFSAASLDFFESKVRPLLAKRCFECHGAEKQESDLRLDARRLILQGGASGEPAAVAGDVDGSSIIQAVRYTGDYAMPPDEALSDDEIAVLEKWVALGLPWPDTESVGPLTMSERVAEARSSLWSLQPIERPEIPFDPNDRWSYTPLDRLIHVKLTAAGLTPSADADRRTLLRRLKSSLLGLPVTQAEVDSFREDDRPDAYSRRVETYLANPAFGERWGRHWLDVARYADTRGYAFARDRRYPYAYTYRDYVIRAMNDDKPYDRFVLEQLAADTMDLGEDRSALAAMGFITTGRRFNNLHDDIDDRIDVVSRGLLGMTVACARCHDHKYDAIPTEDYYSLYGVFASSTEPGDLPLLGAPAEIERYRAYLEQLNSARRVRDQFVAQRQADFIEHGRAEVGAYLQVVMQSQAPDPPSEEATEGQPAEPAANLALQAAFVKSWQDYLRRRGLDRDPLFGPWVRLRTQRPQEFASAARSLAKQIQQNQGGEFNELNGLLRDAFVTSPPQSFAELAQLYGRLFGETHRLWKEKGADDAALRALSVDHQQLALVLYDNGSPTRKPEQQLREFLSPEETAELDRLEAAVRSVEEGAPEPLPRAMVLEDRAQPVQPVVFIRGQPGRRGDHVPRQFLELLEGERRAPFQQGSGRRELADKIIDPENPLTARVIVNRLWMHHFGEPLVDSPSDFGVRSDEPLQIEVLDYLAALLIEHDWSLKAVHREIVRSRVYQQASLDRGECREIDPDNRRLWKMNRQVLEFESLRDSLLFVCGELDRSMHGPAEPLVGATPSHRRAIYGTVDRQDLPNLFRVFDFASPDQSIAKRSRTIVPQQALFLMNSPFAIDCGQQLAKRVPYDPEHAEVSIDALYRQVLAREPRSAELEVAKDFMSQPLQDGESTRLSRWEQLCQLLLMTNEFAYVD